LFVFVGCGKTLTAEAIAELLKKPLYIVTAGDLGISASDVEKNLGSVLELCQTWDALVLIDEADVFLEARSSTEIERNALVCVMLRLLEYYSGCLFLSSNRSASSIGKFFVCFCLFLFLIIEKNKNMYMVQNYLEYHANFSFPFYLEMSVVLN
jgi:SpoVK/Ycf46/Vps4 family AAA+-type ATPase